MMNDKPGNAPTFPTSRRSDKIEPMQLKRVVGYIRVSTDMQAQFGLSLEQQEDQLRSYCKTFGYDLKAVFVDHDSAKDIKGRPAYQKMFSEYVDPGKADAILCSCLDRFSRSQRDFLDFSDKYVETNRANLMLIRESINTDTAVGRQMLPILVAFAALERQRTAERVSGIIKYIRAQGGHYGKVPFGYTTVAEGRLKKLVRCPDTYPWLERMSEWYKSGISFDEIAIKLNENNIKPSQSQKWTKTSVYDLLVKEKIHIPRSERSVTAVFDRDKAFEIAYRMKSEERTMPQIARALNEADLRPGKSSKYETWSVAELLRSVPIHNRKTAEGMALHLRTLNLSFAEIAKRLTDGGFRTPRGGQWYPSSVKTLVDRAISKPKTSTKH